jgi:predicted transcriptional regulator
MPAFSQTIHKNKVVLSDYNYTADIENRLFLAGLSLFEVEVLRELLNGSLKTSLTNLAEQLGCNKLELTKALETLGKLKLFTIQADNLILDKEQRKYYESQIIKFDDDFKPDMEFLQSLLNKVPIHVLPNWYSLSGASDHIFNSIIEKFLLTPKIYERYLNDLVFTDPILNKIVKEMRTARNFRIYSHDLIEKYKLSRKQFEEYVLHLEFNFICCLSYCTANNVWEEVLTPFHEWREYLELNAVNKPTPIHNIENITRTHEHDFGFLLMLNSLLSNLTQKKAEIKPENKYIAQTLCLLKLAEIKNGILEPLSTAAEWLKLPLADQALFLYRSSLNKPDEKTLEYTDKDYRQIEKNLKYVADSSWIYLDDFKKFFTKPLRNNKPTSLNKIGKRWKYTPPQFTDKDYAFIQKTIFGRLYETGMVKTGLLNNKPVFSVTAFGRVTLTD